MLDKTQVDIANYFVLEDSHVYFDGHFDQKKILPGVAQISLCTSYYYENFNKAISLSRARFYKEIQPGLSISIRHISNCNSKIVFELFDQNELCSKITFSIEQ
jgi:3-hydroxymyristoyl/3-hydroxydecanoyl-(acyl carrier protein) dehydratase